MLLVTKPRQFNYQDQFQVGGEISNTIMYYMKPFGRIAVCGAISGYNDIQQPKGNINKFNLGMDSGKYVAEASSVALQREKKL